ncbi:sensor histidine kinase [Actinoplanes subglobosus]|uniref:histidine kinase n=1 Tax=Actinoplanes subglobosus TaxID=1547892 RepID=A0ABV8J4U6_9ACTN
MSWVKGLWWLAVDLAVALVLTAASAEELHDDADRWWTFTVLMVTGLLLCRHRPLVAVVLTSVGALGHHVPEPSGVEALDLTVPIALFALAAADERRRRTGAIACGVMMAVITVLSLTLPLPAGDIANLSIDTRGIAVPEQRAMIPFPEPEMPSIADRLMQSSGLMLALVAAYLLGDNLRGRRIHLRIVERRAADLEREGRQRVALATAAERARITRELHDVVAHGLSVMVVQAQGAAAALKRHPERTETALRDIVTTGRSSLAEMRRLLAIVREEPELVPQPGVDALPELIDRVRAAGTTVTFTVDGDPSPLPAGVDLSAYRIAQEALTNTLKHAGEGATARVRLGFHPDMLEIEVSDDGREPPARLFGAPGNGLRGIAERVRLLDGTLQTGPLAAGGFRVLAGLPLRPTTLPPDLTAATPPASPTGPAALAPPVPSAGPSPADPEAGVGDDLPVWTVRDR